MNSAPKRILWFCPTGMSKAQQGMLRPFLQKRGINHAQVIFVSLGQKFPKYRYWTGKGKNEKKWALDAGQRDAVSRTIAKYITDTRAAAIVINCEMALAHFVDQRSLDTCRGSTYHINKVPAIVLDHIYKVHRVKEFAWLYQSDLAKLKRWMDGTQRIDPKFTYTRATSATQLAEFCAKLDNGIYLSYDLETGKDFISSVSYTLVDRDGYLTTLVVPHHCPVKETGCYWDSEEEEIEIWHLHRDILSHSIMKGMQNGLYDCAWSVRYRVPLLNWLLDSQHMFHSTFAETYQSLEYITSFFVDTYRYWKNDIKGDADQAKKNEQINTWEGMEIFWRYNGLDTYFTALCIAYCARLLAMPQMKWAAQNYGKEFRLQAGPCFAMTMRGMRASSKRQLWMYEAWLDESCKALDELRLMSDEPTFNPNSSQQFGRLLFDILGAKPVAIGAKGKKKKEGTKTTDEKSLKFVRLQHPLYAMVIDKVWEMKKPANMISNFGELEIVDNRMLYSLSMRTETGRMASSNHPFWFGRNIQNWPDGIREMLIADPGYFIFDADYSQSDSYFVAFESQDEKMIANVLDERDTHSIHAAFFFKKTYDEIYKRYKAKDPWAIHPIKGVRQNSKRIGHGANYRMRGGTLYVVMGHEAVVSTGLAMGFTEAAKWTGTQAKAFCQHLLDLYVSELYPTLPKWYKRLIENAVESNNKLTCYGGLTRLFFGNVKDDENIHREMSAYMGQGGTAGNINRALDTIYYSDLETGGGNTSGDIRVHIQAHDAIIGQCRFGKEDKLNNLLQIMREPVTINGNTFNIPVECEVGLSWGKGGLIKYKQDNFDRRDLEANERKLRDKYNNRPSGSISG